MIQKSQIFKVLIHLHNNVQYCKILMRISMLFVVNYFIFV